MSLAGSEQSRQTTTGTRTRRKRRVTRSTTTLHLAHPAPTLTQKQRFLQIRPRILLQLQTVAPQARPTPALDVVPSTLVVPRLTKRFPRMFRGNAQLGVNDVMVLKSEDYGMHDSPLEDVDSDDDGLACRDLLAVICQMRKDEGGLLGRAEIVLGDGTVWTATPRANGIFEFVTVDERGFATRARWVRRARKNSDASSDGDPRFSFSILDPNSRRHPILATMTQNVLEIPDSYTSVSASSRKYPPSTPLRLPLSDSAHGTRDDVACDRTTHILDEQMKTLVQVTAIWVALRQGWSPYFRYSDMIPTCPSISTRGRLRSISLTREPARASPQPLYHGGTRSSTPESQGGPRGPASKMRRACSVMSPSIAPASSPRMERSPMPTRSTSTGTAFMQRASARRVGPSRTVLGESDEDTDSAHVKTVLVHDAELLGSLVSSPISDASPGPRTPTLPRRRVVSAYIPRPHIPHLSHLPHLPPLPQLPQLHRKTTDTTPTPPTPHPLPNPHKSRPGRWKGWTSLFRRHPTEALADSPR